MKEVILNAKEGVFFTKEEYDSLCNKIKANNELIRKLMEEVGLNE